MSNLVDLILNKDEEGEFNPHYPIRQYNNQEMCQHQNFTLMFNHGKMMFKCKCTLTVGEDQMDVFMPILLEEYKKNIKRGSITLQQL